MCAQAPSKHVSWQQNDPRSHLSPPSHLRASWRISLRHKLHDHFATLWIPVAGIYWFLLLSLKAVHLFVPVLKARDHRWWLWLEALCMHWCNNAQHENAIVFNSACSHLNALSFVVQRLVLEKVHKLFSDRVKHFWPHRLELDCLKNTQIVLQAHWHICPCCCIFWWPGFLRAAYSCPYTWMGEVNCRHLQYAPSNVLHRRDAPSTGEVPLT